MISKRFVLQATLWMLVIVVAAMTYFRSASPDTADHQNQQALKLQLESEAGPDRITTTADGRAIATTPWIHLPDVDQFTLTDQNGNPLDSADLHRTPYVVSFFFSSCPSFCRDLNKQIQQSNQAVRDQDIRFLTITVDPDVDTVPVLKKYADGFDARTPRWSFLTGPIEDLTAIGENSFNVVVDRDTHTDDILLVDKWGRYRDRFKWSSAEDMKRFIGVVSEVCAETKPPVDQSVRTRNVMAGIDPPALSEFAWLRDFHGTTSGQEPFFSRDLTGQVWLAHFWGAPADGSATAERLVKTVRQLESAPKIVSLVARDTNAPVSVSEFDQGSVFTAASLDATVVHCSPEKYHRVVAEYFGIADQRDGQTVALVDRWGKVREQIAVDDQLSDQQLAEQLRQALERYDNDDLPPR